MDRRKVYVRIADDLRNDIASGRLAVGDPLPSIAQLVERNGAAKATVERALAVLREEGLIQSRQGSPSVVVAIPEHEEAGDSPQEPSQEFTLLWAQLQEIKESLRQQRIRLDELDERTKDR
ncbi:GntR family transcriptional regulator [Actinomadura rupiterrae]|uniref:GntR family transcriptional regulator n=1 Tax=Actinomadura rupiterrae TaxID=559627 RepID=UPI0020A46B48|nr:winged helix-turn-helix domain-containing protein [Actinomadura rupiterrae]MCP2340405.1 DNA-binding GntR family transcriptional regulator [Actinomadura rupiterrae]